MSAPSNINPPSRTGYGLRRSIGIAEPRPSTSRCPSSLGPAPPRRETGASKAIPRSARSTLVETLLTAQSSDHVGGVDDGALAGVMDQGVLDVERVARHDALDQVLFTQAVQREPEPAAEDGAALLDEGGDRVVEVLLAGKC